MTVGLGRVNLIHSLLKRIEISMRRPTKAVNKGGTAERKAFSPLLAIAFTARLIVGGGAFFIE